MSDQRRWTETALDFANVLDLFAGCSCSPHQRSSCIRGSSRQEEDIDFASPQTHSKRAKFYASRSSASPELPLSSASSGEERYRVEACPESRSDTYYVFDEWQEGLGTCKASSLQLGGDAPPSASRRKTSALHVDSWIEQVALKQDELLPDQLHQDFCLERSQKNVATQKEDDSKAGLIVEIATTMDAIAETKTLDMEISDVKAQAQRAKEEASGACVEFSEFQAAFRMDTSDSDAALFGEFQSAFSLRHAGDDSVTVEKVAQELDRGSEAEGMVDVKADASSVDSLASKETTLSKAEDDWPCDVCDNKTEETLQCLTLSADRITGALAGAIDAEYRTIRGSLYSGGVPVNTHCSAVECLYISTEGMTKSAAKVDDDSLNIVHHSRNKLADEEAIATATETTAQSSSEGSVESDHEFVTDTCSSEDLPVDEMCDAVSSTCKPGFDHPTGAIPSRIGSNIEDVRVERFTRHEDEVAMIATQGETHLSGSEFAREWLRLLLLRCASVCS